MKPSDILRQKQDEIRQLLIRYSATNLRIFGSALNGKDHDGSDLDLLVDALPGATLFDLGELQQDLETLLGIPVDLLTSQDLPIQFRDTVIAQARVL